MRSRPVKIEQIDNRRNQRRPPMLAHLVTEPTIGRPLWALVSGDDEERELRTSGIEHIIFDLATGALVVKTANSTYKITSYTEKSKAAA